MLFRSKKAFRLCDLERYFVFQAVRLSHSSTGEASVSCVNSADQRWLLLAYDFAGIMLDYFVVTGEKRAPSRGRNEIRHQGISVGAIPDLAEWKQRIAASGVEMWTEDHGGDEHVYFFDPSGNLFELTADKWTVRAKGTDPVAAAQVLAAWRERQPA